MNRIRVVFFILFVLSTPVYSLAQPGADPAVTSRNLTPSPLASLGSPFAMTFTIGNNGTTPISGLGFANQMQWGICLGKCAPATADPLNSLSGPLLNYFDVRFTPPANSSEGGCFNATQKQGITIGPVSVYDIYINAVVTKASTTTSVNDIGAACNISPNALSGGQPTDNDFVSIYTHTTTLAMPVALVDFTASTLDNRTALIRWTTAWEKNNQVYQIERSKDLKSFETIGEVKDVAGTSSEKTTYQFVDKTPYRGTSYYRLRQLDVDGSSKTFDAKSIVLDAVYGVYPNPVISPQFTVSLDEPQTAVLHLYDALGGEVDIKSVEYTDTTRKLASAQKLTSGVYILTVEERGTLRKHRLLVL